jgi:hypothetical protein
MEDTNVPEVKPKRKYKKHEKPDCEKIVNEYPFKKLVYFGDPLDRRHNRVGIGIFWNNKDTCVALMPFNETKAGEIRWSKRSIRNAGTGAWMAHYDMVLVKISMLSILGDALKSTQIEWFGGQKESEKTVIKQEIEVKERCIVDSIDDKLKRLGDSW